MLLFCILSCTNENTQSVVDENQNIEQRAITESCINDDFDWNICSDVLKSISIELPQYPGCTFNIDFHYIICLDPFIGTPNFHLNDYNLVSHDCPQYNLDVQNAINSNTIEAFSLAFDADIWHEISLDLIGQSSTFGWAPTIQYLASSCVNYCYFTGTKGDFEYLSFEKTKCGSGCCRITSYYQYVNGVLVLDYQEDETGDHSDCNQSEIFQACPLGTIYSTDCTLTCSNFIGI